MADHVRRYAAGSLGIPSPDIGERLFDFLDPTENVVGNADGSVSFTQVVRGPSKTVAPPTPGDLSRAAATLQIDRAPDCATARAAEVAGRFSGLVMRGASMTVGEDNTLHPQFEVAIADLVDRVDSVGDGEALKRDIVEGVRIAQLMIEARARSSIRTPNRAALSAAEAALALAEDALGDREDGDELPDAHAVLASIRDALRAGLDPLHAAEATGQAPYDAGPPRA